MKEDKNKDGKVKDAQDTKALKDNKGGGAIIPGFARGKFSSVAGDGNWTVNVTCVNGDPARSFVTKLPLGVTFYGGGEIANPADTTLYLPDGANIDPNMIFPWDPTDTNPLRLGGGVINGTILEGAQRANAGPKDPILAPFISTKWANGAAYRLDVYIGESFGLTCYPGESAFGLVMMDAAGQAVLKSVAKSEGSCLDSATA